ncbi:MAG TPA: magnesium/cobalt transporter CorA, partial [Acidobacteriota bacterium]|nr:magnesium/cobalt transporter CorA [Acidobacteriota bacterium]
WHQIEMTPENLYWWDLFNLTDEETQVLSQKFQFHPLAIEDCLHDVHYPKVDYYETYLYLVVHGVDIDLTKTEGFAPKELDIFLSENYIVTYHEKDSRSINDVMRRAREKVPLFEFGVDFVLYSLLDVMVVHYLPVLESLEEQLEATEDRIFENPSPNLLRDILELKRTVIRLKRTVFPQREVINHLSRNEYHFVQKRTQAYFRDVYDHLYRMAEMTESFRDMSTAMVEAYLSTVSNRMNEIMKVLTTITTIFMPLTVITGIYGMNFQHMPELGWRYGYFAVLLVMLLVAGCLIFYFRRRKWL